MIFEDFFAAQSLFLWSAFAIAVVMGAIVNKTNFCTMGAVSDWVNMGDMGRMRSWLFAMAIAILGVVGLEHLSLVTADGSFPPYRGSRLVWFENLFGGFLFGIGMTLASGCGNKNLVRAGAGNIKSIFVLAIISVIAYYMVNPFPGTDDTLYSVLFLSWTEGMAVTLPVGQDLGSLLAGNEAAADARLWIGGVLGLLILAFVFLSAEFRSSLDHVLGGFAVGLAVLAAWYFSSGVALDIDGESHDLRSYVQQWDFLAESDEGKPADSRPMGPQSFTFINPVGQFFGYAGNGFDKAYLTFGIMAALGVILGSFLWAILSRSFRIEWFSSGKDFFNHVIGAVLMGFGGVLALGCTIGQAITGISTLALGSVLTFISIVFGCALMMKIQLYKMVYEDASFMDVLLTSLADLKVLPSSLRKLEAV